MRLVRNWLLPILGMIVAFCVAAVVMGMPGVRYLVTVDGVTVGEYIEPDQIPLVLKQAKEIGSYIDFYGLRLPGEPLFWSIGIFGTAMVIGYRIGSLFKIRTAKGEAPAASEQGSPT